ncbi:hypothetical protein BKA70DRAFT_1436362 [Coprinopsis sp. MPI-PUGE-AT-0042]|nr:hypothetical protein BKA70DRAFT_1436362 [Coprinopsis sp. MPI-PUGE-AT-0042]
MPVISLKDDAIKRLWDSTPSDVSPQEDPLSHISSSIKEFQKHKVAQHILKSDPLEALSKLATGLEAELRHSSVLSKLGYTDFQVTVVSGKFLDQNPCSYHRLCLSVSGRRPRWYLVSAGPSDWKPEAFGGPSFNLVDNYTQLLADVWAPAIRESSPIKLGKCIHLILDAVIKAIDTGVSRQNLQAQDLAVTHERFNYSQTAVYRVGTGRLPWKPTIEHPYCHLKPIGLKARESVADVVKDVSTRLPFIYSGDIASNHGFEKLVDNLQHHFWKSLNSDVSVQVGLRCLPHEVAPSIIDGSLLHRLDFTLALWIYQMAGSRTDVGYVGVYAGMEYNPALNPSREGLLRGYKLVLDELEASIRHGSSSGGLVWFL